MEAIPGEKFLYFQFSTLKEGSGESQMDSRALPQNSLLSLLPYAEFF